MKYLRFISIGLATVVLIYFYFDVYQNNRQDNRQNAGVEKIAQKQWPTKKDEQGQISVAVTPLALNKDDPQWKFEITLDTHTVPLDQDLAETATLIDDKGNTNKPLFWEGAGPGGHHREGILIFQPINPAPAYVELKIKDLGSIPERSFKWSLK